MWRRFRAVLLSHVVACWLVSFAQQASNYQWIFEHRHDPQFLPTFAAATIGAPLFLPIISMRSLRYRVNISLFISSMGLYSVTIVAVLSWWWHHQSSKIIEKRRKLGQCVACGYDLRASADKCPECGKIVEIQVNSPTDSRPT